LLSAGLTPEVIIAKIESSNCDFDTSPDTLKVLKAANVPDAVILAMVQATKAERNVVYADCLYGVTVHSGNSVESPSVATVPCGDTLVTLGREGDYFKVRTDHGVVGYVFYTQVSNTKPETRARNPQSSPAEPAQSPVNQSSQDSLPPNVLRAVAWRAVPWVTTTYLQRPGRADTDCTGSGTWSGTVWQGDSTCTTQYTPAQSVPMNWYHMTIYNLVETADSRLVIACTRNWSFSKCAYLTPGDAFPYEMKKGRIEIKGQKAGKKKEQTLTLDLVSTERK
jgi:hypothetical protein